MPNKSRVVLMLFFDEKTEKGLRLACERERRSMADQVAQLVENWLAGKADADKKWTK